MSEKFTPGPWDWMTCSFPTTSMRIVEPRAIVTCQKTHKNIATLEYSEDAEETNSNARLIAAAPDMYEALKEALTVIDQSEHALGIERDAVDAIKMALAKADGTP